MNPNVLEDINADRIRPFNKPPFYVRDDGSYMTPNEAREFGEAVLRQAPVQPCGSAFLIPRSSTSAPTLLLLSVSTGV